MVSTRRARALAVALAICGTPVEAVAVTPRPQAPEALLVGGQGEATATTGQRTHEGRWYAITVTGTISYNGRLALQDCGHYDAPDAAGWVPNSVPRIDGVPAQCTRVPASASHTYCWAQRGTGAPFVFSMPVAQGAADDDVGALLVVVEPLTGDRVPASCPPVPVADPTREPRPASRLPSAVPQP